MTRRRTFNAEVHQEATVARRIIDMHHHLFDAGPMDATAEEYGRLGVEKAVIAAVPPRRVPDSNRIALAAQKKYPDLFVPFVGFDLDEMKPGELKGFREEGFVGIKFIAPSKPYNDFSYFPVYEKARELGMPALFHLGIVANCEPWDDCDSSLMRPIYLDHIARSFPGLTIVGAHLGNPWYEEATMSCRWNPNLFFDLSGSTLKKKTPEFLGSLLWWTRSGAYSSSDGRHPWEKIVFGSDTSHEDIEGVIHDYENVMSVLGLSEDLQEAIWYKTAARILGVGI